MTSPSRAASSAPTITDVAREAGVSKAAVSKVIRDAYGVSPEMRARVGAAIAKLDYRPRLAARTMRGSSRTVGIELPEIGSDFFTKVVSAIATGLSTTDHQLIIAPIREAARAQDAITSLADRQVSGIVAVSPLVESSFLERIAATLPVVSIGRHDDAENYDVVVGNDLVGTQQVMDHLVAMGHRRIAHLTLHEVLVDASRNDGHTLRHAEYRRYMSRIGEGDIVVRTDGTMADCHNAVTQLLTAEHPPTAIFAGHDALALTSLRVVSDLGLGPDKVAVVGYDNTDIASHPLISLSSVDQFGEQLGMTAAKFLLERMGGRSEPRSFHVRPELRVRRSSDHRALPA